jgi:hypothetical protein
MSIRFALSALLFSLLAACSAAPDTTENDPTNEPPVQVEVDESTSVTPSMLPGGRGACECNLAAGSKVWKCNGKCSDAELRNLPH